MMQARAVAGLCAVALVMADFCTAARAAGKSAAAAVRPALQTLGSPLQLYEKIPLPGLEGRIDHLSGNGRLILFSVVGSNAVGVENWFEGRLIHSFKAATEPQGVLYVPGFNKIVSAGADGKVLIFDAGSYTLQKTIDLGGEADNLRWDARHKWILVGYGEEDGGIGAIDPATNELLEHTVVKTGGHPESFQIETQGNRVFVNCPDAGQVVESIERDTGKMTQWPIKGAKGNYAMALNEPDQRLYTATRKRPYLIVFDTEGGREVARVPGIVGEADDVYFDAARKRIYVIGGEGFISVVQQLDAGHYKLIANVPSIVGGRTGYWYPQHDRLYVAVQAHGNEPAQLLGYEAQD